MRSLSERRRFFRESDPDHSWRACVRSQKRSLSTAYNSEYFASLYERTFWLSRVCIVSGIWHKIHWPNTAQRVRIFVLEPKYILDVNFAHTNCSINGIVNRRIPLSIRFACSKISQRGKFTQTRKPSRQPKLAKSRKEAKFVVPVMTCFSDLSSGVFTSTKLPLLSFVMLWINSENHCEEKRGSLWVKEKPRLLCLRFTTWKHPFCLCANEKHLEKLTIGITSRIIWDGQHTRSSNGNQLMWTRLISFRNDVINSDRLLFCASQRNSLFPLHKSRNFLEWKICLQRCVHANDIKALRSVWNFTRCQFTQRCDRESGKENEQNATNNIEPDVKDVLCMESGTYLDLFGPHLSKVWCVCHMQGPDVCLAHVLVCQCPRIWLFCHCRGPTLFCFLGFLCFLILWKTQSTSLSEGDQNQNTDKQEKCNCWGTLSLVVYLPWCLFGSLNNHITISVMTETSSEEV